MSRLYKGNALRPLFVLFVGAIFTVGVGCTDQSSSRLLFERREASVTGVEFLNDLSPSNALNVVRWPYFYNGGGIAVGDLNNNGRVDLYFTANQGPNRLYLNTGDFQFEEVTERAGVAGTADWSSGVTIVDVNGDGLLDIYVSTVVGYSQLEGHNELYINQGVDDEGIPRFEEKAAAYGLDHRAHGIQAVFFDYDGDGDLDMYQLNGLGSRPRQLPPSKLRTGSHDRIGDRLYRNDDSVFVDVSEEAGIFSGRTGAGLGVATGDFDQNGCPDLYVANDFYEHDYLYYNNCDGTFTESIEEATGHTSYSSMGVDVADYTNNGRPDIAVLDMLPFQEDILKRTEPPDDPQTYRGRRQYGYHHQLDRNTLQLNQGDRHFSEIGLLAGVAATDWSWAPLFADLDNNGRKDLFVTNGIYRRLNDLDYFDYAFQEGRLRELERGDTEPYKELRKRMPHAPTPNFAFYNEGDLTFADSSGAWGLDRSGYSNGAAYADLDNDGTLDLVVNNVNEPASIYENRADTLRDHHYLKVALEGDERNTRGIGAKVVVHQGERRQMQRQQVTRGYLSSVDPRLNFGLGSQGIDSLRVVWPDGRVERRSDVAVDQTITLRQEDATRAENPFGGSSRDAPVTTISADSIGIDFQHDENTAFSDFRREPLMPRKLSTEGPALAVGDVTGNGLDDVYLGGATGQSGGLYLQQSNGQFRASDGTEEVWAGDQDREDVDAAFFDATGNGALDLYVVSGGNEGSGEDSRLRDRLYVNDGTGDFRRTHDRLPEQMVANGAVVAPGDFDGDGDVDLFVGSRSVPGNYGHTPESYLLENDGTGHFTDVTDRMAPGLRSVGMVTDAVWTDIRGSEALDLAVVGEWMPITIFEQEEKRFVDRTQAAGLSDTNGWWTALHAVDPDDGEESDLVAGNFGRNSRLRPAPNRPVRLYLNDFNGDGQSEPILTRPSEGKHFLWARRDELIQEFPSFKEEFPTYESFGAKQIREVFSSRKVQEATVKEAHTFATVYVENRRDTSVVTRLPARAQFAPVYDVITPDVGDKEVLDIILGGNLYGVTPRQGRYDASYGTILQKNDGGGWEAVSPVQSNVYLQGEVRTVRLVDGPDGLRRLLVARNDDAPMVVSVPPSVEGFDLGP